MWEYIGFFVCLIGKFMVGLFKIVEILMVLDFIIFSCLMLGIFLKGFNIVFFNLCNVLLLLVFMVFIL